MARPIKTLKEAIVSKISNNGSDVAVDDNLDLQSSNEIKNASAVKTDDSVTVSTGEATDTVHYGSNQDRGNAGDTSVAIGIGAEAPGDDGSGGSIGSHVAVGYQAGQSNTGNLLTAVGFEAAQSNTGGAVAAVGYQAAKNNIEDSITAMGFQAAEKNEGFGVIAAGYFAAQSNTGNRLTAVGLQAALDNTGDNVTTAGYQAAKNNTGGDITAVGHRAARGDGLADPTTMGDDNIGIGDSAIRNNQASGLIAIGQEAGINAQTDDQLIITDRNGNRRIEADLSASLDFSLDGTAETNDGMTNDPESATEDGYLTININGTDYQTPLYTA